MGPLLYEVMSAWPGADETPASIGRKFLSTLDQLSAREDFLRDWGSTDHREGTPSYPIDALRGSIAQWVADHVKRDDFDMPDARFGYWVHAFTDNSDVGPGGRKACFQVRAGSQGRNYAMFEVGNNFHPPDTDLASFELYRAALLTTIAVWPSKWAVARCSIWGEDPPTLPGEPPFPYSGFQMPWMGYLDKETAAGIEPPAGVKSEATPDGGLLLIATEQRFDPSKVEHMRPSRLIAEILISHEAGLGR